MRKRLNIKKMPLVIKLVNEMPPLPSELVHGASAQVKKHTDILYPVITKEGALKLCKQKR